MNAPDPFEAIESSPELAALIANLEPGNPAEHGESDDGDECENCAYTRAIVAFFEKLCDLAVNGTLSQIQMRGFEVDGEYITGLRMQLHQPAEGELAPAEHGMNELFAVMQQYPDVFGVHDMEF